MKEWLTYQYCIWYILESCLRDQSFIFHTKHSAVQEG